jgi:ABC-2 type transport system permease protein
MTLYFLIFGGLIGSRVGAMDGIRYMDFIVPGLVMMSVIQNSYGNISSSFFGAKFGRHVEELLVSPMPNGVILGGYVAGAVLRGVMVGIIVLAIAMLFTPVRMPHPFVTLTTVLLGATIFSLAGFVNAVYAKKFDDIALVPTFILTPLTYLGGVFYSVKLLPDWAQTLTHLNPIFYMVNAFRYGLLGVSDVPLWVAYGLMIGFVVVLSAIGLWLLQRASGCAVRRQPEEPRRRLAGGRGDRFDRFTPVPRQLFHDVRQVHRLVAAMRRLRAHRARQQVGRVGFDHQATGGNVLHQFAQVQAAAFVAQPAGDAHVPVLVEVIEQLFARPREAMHHRGPQPAVEIAHRRHEVGVRIRWCRNSGLPVSAPICRLHLERPALRRPRREIAEVVQPAFAHGDDFRQGLQCAHLGIALGGVLGGVVRMHAGGGEQLARMGACELGRHGRMRAAGAGDDHPRHPRVACALQDRGAIVVEAVVGEVGADVDKHGAQV